MEVTTSLVSEFIGAIAQHGSAGVAILAMIILAFLIDKFLKVYANIEESNKQTNDSFQSTVKENTEVTKEMSQYLKLRNGSLEKMMQEFTEVIAKCKK